MLGYIEKVLHNLQHSKQETVNKPHKQAETTYGSKTKFDEKYDIPRN